MDLGPLRQHAGEPRRVAASVGPAAVTETSAVMVESGSLNSKFTPAVAGVQYFMDIPFGVWKNPMRGTPLGAALIAGIMASSSGIARTAPTP